MDSGRNEVRDDVAEVNSAHAAVLDAARPEAVEFQHRRGKLTARERIDLLLDPDGRVEYGPVVTPESLPGAVSADGREKATALPFEGPITVSGFVDGRPVAVRADDFTLLGGSGGKLTGQKMRAMTDLALRRGYPLITLIDSGGHRIHSMDSRFFAAGGAAAGFTEMAQMSGWAPSIAAVMGPAFAGPMLTAAMADFVPIVRGTGALGMAGPKLVKAAIGEDLSAYELGGADVQTRSGAADLECESDLACIQAIKEYLSFLPTNASEPLPILETDDPPHRHCPELRDVVPTERRRAYDVRAVLTSIADDRHVFELRANYAANIVTAFLRMGGIPVGVLANQPQVLAGALDTHACIKASRFISFCNAFGIPILSLIDTPGTMVGSKAEVGHAVRASGKLLVALGHVTVPLISIVLRKAYGAGYVGMGGGRSCGAEAAWVWPTAEVQAMGIEGSVDIAYHRAYESAPDPMTRRQELIDELYRETTALRAASGFGVDDVIDPADTRRLAISVLRANHGRRRTSGPPKVQFIDPM
jgi:acetyl-CoA carboxylase carboxyltransferase component